MGTDQSHYFMDSEDALLSGGSSLKRKSGLMGAMNSVMQKVGSAVKLTQGEVNQSSFSSRRQTEQSND